MIMKHLSLHKVAYAKASQWMSRGDSVLKKDRLQVAMTRLGPM